MTLVNSYQEFEEFYPYKNCDIKVYPKEYPCLVKAIDHDGGIYGDWYSIEVIYIPKDVDQESFVKGVQEESETLDSCV